MKVNTDKKEIERFKTIHKLFVNTDNRISNVWFRLKTFDKVFNLLIFINVALMICIALLTYEVSNLKG